MPSVFASPPADRPPAEITDPQGLQGSEYRRYKETVQKKELEDEAAQKIFAGDTNEPEEKKGMVTLVVTIEKELLKRIDANVQPNLEAEGITRVEVGEEGLHFISERERGQCLHCVR